MNYSTPRQQASTTSTPSAGKGFGVWLKDAIKDWVEDKATKLSAALAFYVILSLAPLLVIILKIATAIFGAEAATKQVQEQLNQLVGSAGADAIREMLAHASQPHAGIIATIISLAIVAFSASAVFGELQDSLDTIWEVKPRPGRGWWQTVKGRFFNISMVFVICFLLLVSLFFSVVLTSFGHRIFGDGAWLWIVLDIFVSTIVVTLLVSALFYLLPDVKISWRDVILGALITAVLFKLGQYVLGLYFRFGSTTSPYGAAGSLVAVLLWAYYSGWIFFFGAEFTQVYARAHGRGVVPTEGAIRIDHLQNPSSSETNPSADLGVRTTPMRS
jgi:membrane protein